MLPTYPNDLHNLNNIDNNLLSFSKQIYGDDTLLKVKYDFYQWHKFFFFCCNKGESRLIDSYYDNENKIKEGEGINKFLCTLFEAKLTGTLHCNLSDLPVATDLAFLASYGIGKTLLLNSFIVFTLIHIPQTRILYFGATKALAESRLSTDDTSCGKFLNPSLTDILAFGQTGFELFELFSGYSTQKKRGKDGGFFLKEKRGYIKPMSYESTFQGEQADLVVFDDFATEQDSVEILLKKQDAVKAALGRLRDDLFTFESFKQLSEGRQKKLGSIVINNNVGELDTARFFKKDRQETVYYIELPMVAEFDEKINILDKNQNILYTWHRKQGNYLNPLHKDKQSLMDFTGGDWENEKNHIARYIFQKACQLKLGIGDEFCFQTERISRRWDNMNLIPINKSENLHVIVDTATSIEESADHTVALLVGLDIRSKDEYSVYILDMLRIKASTDGVKSKLRDFLMHNEKLHINNKILTPSSLIIENASSGFEVGYWLSKLMQIGNLFRMDISYIQRNKTTIATSEVKRIKIRNNPKFGKKACYRCFDVSFAINEGKLILPKENYDKKGYLFSYKDLTETILQELKFIRGVDTGQKEVRNKQDDIASCIADAFILAQELAIPKKKPILFAKFQQKLTY